MSDVTIGTVIHNGVLTLAVRCGDNLTEPVQQSISTAQEAVALLLDRCVRHRHDKPAIYIESGPLADPVSDAIRKYEHAPNVHVIDGLGTSFSRFANRRSELHYEFRMQVEEGRLRVPPAYNEQLAAFTQEERNGKVFFPAPLDVADKLGRYPAFAVVAVLAAIETLKGGAGNSESEWDPYDPTRE